MQCRGRKHQPGFESLGSNMKTTKHQRCHLIGILAASLVVLAMAFASSVSAQEAAPFIEDARKYVIESVKEKVTLTLNEKSLMNWTNPARQQERGAVYVWKLDERPAAIGSLFSYEYDSKVYNKHEFHSLSSGPLRSTFAGTLAWTPKSAGIEWKPFNDSPPPGTTHTARLLQMRQFSRPFRAELVSPKDEKTELRLISRPLFEYSSPKSGVIDGAIFSFAVATDPEVLLLIEAFEENLNGTKRAGFRHAFARFHYWNVAVYEGDKKIWNAPLDETHATNEIGNTQNIGKIYNSYHPKR